MSVVLAEKLEIILDGESLTFEQMVAVARYGAKARLNPETKEKILE